MRESLRAHLAALVCMVVAAPLTLGAVLTLNRYSQPPQQERGPNEVSFQVKPPPPPPPKQEPDRRPPRQPRSQQRAALPPMPSLGANLSGVDLGLGDLDLVGLEAVSDSVLGDMDDVVHTEATVDERPQPRLTTPIAIPPLAKSRNLSGHVLLNLLIAKDGSVRQVKVLEAEPAGVFEEAATLAVRGWLFEPATYQGAPVEVWATLPIQFQP